MEQWQSFQHLTPLNLSETKRDESTSTHADNGVAYSRFKFILIFILNKMRRTVFRVKQCFWKSVHEIKAFYFIDLFWWLQC